MTGAPHASPQGRTRVLVTRPAHDAGLWVEQLQQGGFDAQALPLIEIAPASSAAAVAALQHAWQTLDGYAACMFVSGNAVEYFFKSKVPMANAGWAQTAINKIANAAQNLVPQGLRLMAPGPGTAAALLAAGVPAGQIDAPPESALQFDSEALWQVIGQRGWQGRRVLLVRGQSQGSPGDGPGSPGRDWLMRQWQAAGASVDVVTVYERRVPQLGQAQLGLAQAASADGSVWLFSSSEAVANLRAAPGLPALDWSRARAVATHPRIAQTVQAVGWGVVVESRPALKDILVTLRSIESGYS
ncbi:MAG: uroporphyrinogen-III synthase [Pseudomonadota bacterium]